MKKRPENCTAPKCKTLAAISLCMLLSAGCLSACGSSTDTPQRIQGETIPAQSLPADTLDSQADGTENTETASAPATAAQEENTAPKTAPDTAQEPPAEQPPEAAAPSGNEEAANQSGAQELHGSIETIGENTFTVNQIFTENLGDGSMLAYSSDEDKTLIDVIFTDQTVFSITSSSDGGITSTSTPATKADLETSRSTLMSGQWEGNRFRADKVIIYHFS